MDPQAVDPAVGGVLLVGVDRVAPGLADGGVGDLDARPAVDRDALLVLAARVVDGRAGVGVVALDREVAHDDVAVGAVDRNGLAAMSVFGPAARRVPRCPRTPGYGDPR